MSLPCEIVKDMLVLYKDNTLNRESRTAIEEHLTNCERCRTYWESVQKQKGETVSSPPERVAGKSRQRLKRIVKLVIGITIAVVLLGGWWLFTFATTENPNVFVTTHAYVQLYVFGKGSVTVSNDPLVLYCEARYQLNGTKQRLAELGFEDTGRMDETKRYLLVKDGELYRADISDNRFIAYATVTKADVSADEQRTLTETFWQQKNEVSTGA